MIRNVGNYLVIKKRKFATLVALGLAAVCISASYVLAKNSTGNDSKSAKTSVSSNGKRSVSRTKPQSLQSAVTQQSSEASTNDVTHESSSTTEQVTGDEVNAEQSSEAVSTTHTQQSAVGTSVTATLTNLRGTTGNPAYHDGLPSANEITSLELANTAGNVTTFNYYFKDLLSIASYGRKAASEQQGQMIVTLNNDATVTMQITGGQPVVTNYGTESVGIQSYQVGETRTIPYQLGVPIQALLIQQSFGQSPLGSIDNLAADYVLTIN